MKFGFTPEAEILNARLAMLGFVIAVGTYLTTGQIITGVWLMDTQNLLSMFLGYFVAGMILIIIKKSDDHDDHPGGGMMVPVYNAI